VPTWRQSTPYGGVRGPAVTDPGGRGFLNKPADDTSGLVILGARNYDPDTGRFISLDPMLEMNDPRQLNGYGYASANPILNSDPSGLITASACATRLCYDQVTAASNIETEHNAASCTTRSCYDAQMSSNCHCSEGHGHPDYGQSFAPKKHQDEPKPKVHKHHTFWNTLKHVGAIAVHVAALASPWLTAFAIATAFIPGLDFATSSIALLANLAKVISITTAVVNAVSTAGSAVSVYQDFAGGSTGKSSGGKALDIASFATGVIGLKVGGLGQFAGKGSAMVNEARATAAGAKAFSTRNFQALDAMRTAANKGGNAGREAAAMLPTLRQVKNSGQALANMHGANVWMSTFIDAGYNGVGALATESDNLWGSS
jgi:RHS repeat-associated protein